MNRFDICSDEEPTYWFKTRPSGDFVRFSEAKETLRSARDTLAVCSLLDKSGQAEAEVKKLDKIFKYK